METSGFYKKYFKISIRIQSVTPQETLILSATVRTSNGPSISGIFKRHSVSLIILFQKFFI